MCGTILYEQLDSLRTNQKLIMEQEITDIKALKDAAYKQLELIGRCQLYLGHVEETMREFELEINLFLDKIELEETLEELRDIVKKQEPLTED